MKIKVFPSGPYETNAYVITDTDTGKTAIVDPGVLSAENIMNYIKENTLKPEKILITHSHWDHIGDVCFLKIHLKIPVYVHPEDSPNLEKPGADGLPCWLSIDSTKPDSFLNEGDIITVGNLEFEVIHTPGHSPGGVCFYNAKENVLISGDTLFKGTIGNLSFPTSNSNSMWESLKKLAKLPPNTKVYPGHGPMTTIGDEHWLANAKEFFNG